MQLYIPTDKAAPMLRPSAFGVGISVAVVNQTATDVYMSDTPAELDASATGSPAVGGIRIANGGGQVLWPSTAKVAWFRAILAWVASTAYVVGQTIIDKQGGLWKVTTAGTSGTSFPFPTTEPAIGGTQADNTVTWTFQGVAAIALNVQPG
jgi:hypothetical protein